MAGLTIDQLPPQARERVAQKALCQLAAKKEKEKQNPKTEKSRRGGKTP